MKTKRPWILLCLVLMLAQVFGLSVARADDFTRLRAEAARIKTMQSDFTQKKSMKILSKPLISEGRFYFAAPNSIRWEYVRPLKSVVISDQGETKRFMAAGGKMVEDKSGGVQAMRIVLDEVAGWMSGKFDGNPSFAASLKEEKAATVITLVPAGEAMAGMMRRIEIVVSRQDASVRTVRMVESDTAETLIEFQNVRINEALPDGVFRDVR
ncbi:MAG: outer membrane lipoprotein carrier protein LolA [Smithellaceae bacterium]